MHRRKSSAERFETETSAKTLVMESLLPEFWHFVMLYMHQTGGLSQQSTLSRLIGRLRNTIENPQKITFAMAVMPQSQINIILSVYVYIYIYEVVMSWSSLTVARDSGWVTTLLYLQTRGKKYCFWEGEIPFRLSWFNMRTSQGRFDSSCTRNRKEP